jgi:hypothetical protein
MGASILVLPLLDHFGGELGGAGRELLHRAVERFAVLRGQNLRQAAREVECMRRQLLVHRPSAAGERQEGLAHVLAVGAPHQEPALFEERDRARYLGLVHVRMGADRFSGHDPVLAERHQHPPFRHADPVASRVDARKRLRGKTRHHVELVGKEILELQHRLVAGRRGRGWIGPDFAFDRPVTAHGTIYGTASGVPSASAQTRLPHDHERMDEVAVPRNACLSGCRSRTAGGGGTERA